MEILSKVFNKKLIIGTLFLIIIFSFYGAFADDAPFGQPTQEQENLNKQIEQYKDSSPQADTVTKGLLAQVFGYIPQVGLVSGNLVLQTAFYGFNIGIAALGATLVVYAVFLGLSNTVSSGQPLGQRLHTLFFPMRIAVGSVGLAPIFGGYSLAQLFALWCIIQGTNFADLIWNMSMRAFLKTNIETNNQANSNNNSENKDTSGVTQSDITNLLQSLRVGETNTDIMCQQFTNYLDGVQSADAALIGLNIAYSQNFPGQSFKSLYQSVPFNVMCKNTSVQLNGDPCAALQNPNHSTFGAVSNRGAFSQFYNFCNAITNNNQIQSYNDIFLNNLEQAWGTFISSNFTNPSSAHLESLKSSNSLFTGDNLNDICKNTASSSYLSWGGSLCNLAKLQKLIKESGAGKMLYENILDKLDLGWLFAAPIYFSLESASDVIDLIGNFISMINVKNQDPIQKSSSESFLLPIPTSKYLINNVLSSGNNSNISEKELTKLTGNFSKNFNADVNGIGGGAAFFSGDFSTDIIYQAILYNQKLSLPDVFNAVGTDALERKFLCQLCVPTNSQNMDSQSSSTFYSYVHSPSSDTSICSATVTSENCYGYNPKTNPNPQYWSETGLENITSINVASSKFELSFGDLITLLNVASIKEKNGTSFTNLPRGFTKYDQQPQSGTSGTSTSTESIQYLQNQYVNYVSNKYNQFLDIVPKVTKGNALPSDPELEKITGIFTSSKIVDVINSSNFKLGDINVGMDISMGVIGGFAAMLAKGIIGGSTDSIVSQVLQSPKFPLLEISKRGADVTAEIELIVADLIPGYAIIQGFSTIAALISGKSGSGNLWENLTSLFGMLAEISIYAVLAAADVKLGTVIQYQFYIMIIVIAIVGPLYMMALTMFYLPVIPIIIFLYAVLAWFMTVIEAVVAAPILAIGIMHPQGQDEIFGKSEVGLMMLINAMLRPMLIIIGFISAFIMFRIAFVLYNAFFGTMMNFLPIESIGTYLTFIGTYTGGMIPLVTRIYGLTNQIPENVMTWIGGTHAGARGDAQEALQGARSGAQSAPGEVAGIGKSAAGMGMMALQAKQLMSGKKKEEE